MNLIVIFPEHALFHLHWKGLLDTECRSVACEENRVAARNLCGEEAMYSATDNITPELHD